MDLDGDLLVAPLADTVRLGERIPFGPTESAALPEPQFHGKDRHGGLKQQALADAAQNGLPDAKAKPKRTLPAAS